MESAEWQRWLDKVNATAAPQSTTTSPSGISGYVFLDADRDGQRDAGEKGLIGWKVYVDKNRNGRFDSGELSVTTDSSGYYRILGLPAGSYQIRVVTMSGYTRVSPTSGYRGVTLSAGGRADGRSLGFFKA
jgi:hypothetical protein